MCAVYARRRDYRLTDLRTWQIRNRIFLFSAARRWLTRRDAGPPTAHPPACGIARESCVQRSVDCCGSHVITSVGLNSLSLSLSLSLSHVRQLSRVTESQRVRALRVGGRTPWTVGADRRCSLPIRTRTLRVARRIGGRIRALHPRRQPHARRRGARRRRATAGGARATPRRRHYGS